MEDDDDEEEAWDSPNVVKESFDKVSERSE